jgi:hypothetical protein
MMHEVGAKELDPVFFLGYILSIKKKLLIKKIFIIYNRL